MSLLHGQSAQKHLLEVPSKAQVLACCLLKTVEIMNEDVHEAFQCGVSLRKRSCPRNIYCIVALEETPVSLKLLSANRDLDAAHESLLV